MNDTVQLRHIESGPELQDIRALFLEYARSLDFELCFQGFDKELQELPAEYSKPRGRLILGRVNDQPAGCIALKPLEPRICEMKRLYVRPEFRGQQLGVKLATYIIEEARREAYERMRLDTINGLMPHAIALYSSLGFVEIGPYYHNPIPNALFMELVL